MNFGQVPLRLLHGQALQRPRPIAGVIEGHLLHVGENHEQVGADFVCEHGRRTILVDDGVKAFEASVGQAVHRDSAAARPDYTEPPVEQRLQHL